MERAGPVQKQAGPVESGKLINVKQAVGTYTDWVLPCQAGRQRCTNLALASQGPLPEPARSRVSRRVKSFPVVPRVSLRPDERAQRWLLSVSATDRAGLLYAIARILARHRVNLQLAKVSTLGERVEDTFLVDGPELQQTRAQLLIESELLDAVA